MKTQKEIQPCICGSLDHDSHPNEPQHTPTPWEVDDGIHHLYGDAARRINDKDGMLIGWISDRNLKSGDLRDADAAFIVRAVNAHGELVNTLHHLLNQPELLTDDFYRKQIKEMLVKAESNV